MKLEEMRKILSQFGVPFSPEMSKKEIAEIYEQAEKDGLFNEVVETAEPEAKAEDTVEAEQPKEEKAKSWTIVSPVMHNNVRYEVGQSISDLTEEQADALLRVGSIK